MGGDGPISGDDALVLAHTEHDPLIAAALAAELERSGLAFATRGSGLEPIVGWASDRASVEFWVHEADLAPVLALLETVLPEPGARDAETPFDEPDLPDDDAGFAELPAGELPALFWRRTESGAFLLIGPVVAYARLAAPRGWRAGATAEVRGAVWEFTLRGGYPGRILVDGYLPDDRLLLDLDRDEAAALVRETTGAPISPIRSDDGATWETGDDWVVRLHAASGPRTERWSVEIDPSIAGRPEILLLVCLALFARLRPD